MRRRAVAVVATQGISPVMAMLVALVVALILLLADPVKAQETTTEETAVEETTVEETMAEETTVLDADAADRKVEAETDNVSVKVDNGEVSVSTDDGSSSDDGTGQQSSVTVQQNQATDGTGSRASTGDVNIGASQTSSSSCKNPSQLASITDPDTSASFRTTGNKFRVSYDVLFRNNFSSSNNFKIRITNSSGTDLSTPGPVDEDTNTSFIVNRGSDTYDLHVNVQPRNTTEYTVFVDNCRGNNNNNNNRNRHHRHHDRNRHHHRHHDRNRFHNNRFFGGGAADRQYTSERIVEDRVIRETIPNNKGTLANTGGVPLTGAAVLGLASLGLGVSILRSAVRRDP